MKQLVGISHNLFYNSEKNPMVETIFMIHLPKWEMMDGQPIKKQTLEEVRVVNKFETIEKMFTEYVDETREMIENANAQST